MHPLKSLLCIITQISHIELPLHVLVHGTIPPHVISVNHHYPGKVNKVLILGINTNKLGTHGKDNYYKDITSVIIVNLCDKIYILLLWCWGIASCVFDKMNSNRSGECLVLCGCSCLILGDCAVGECIYKYCSHFLGVIFMFDIRFL